MNKNVKFSVLMPTYNQCAFIRRAILSLMKQTYKEWELIIINDGCTDETEDYIADYLEDPRITYIKNEENTGLGHALNQGLDAAKYDYIAYLPSDDYYFENHLETIKEKFEEDPFIFLVYSGASFKSSDSLMSYPITEVQKTIPGFSFQMVQVAHKKVGERWLTRDEYLTEDLFQMYWHKLLEYGTFTLTNIVTCCWFTHRWQRFKIVSERFGGGLNILRSHYNIKKPVKLKVSKYKFVDEYKLHERFPKTAHHTKEGELKILIVGELAYNYDRIYALEQTGHKIYALWTPRPEFSFSAVGPLPFGNIESIPYDNWEERIKEIKPDVIYGLLNAGAVPFVYHVVKKVPDIPYVWHFKEGPSICFERGDWNKVMYLYKHASGRVYLNEVVRDWYNVYLPPSDNPTMILDGDLPKADYFSNEFSKKLSSQDGEIHTLIAGRMIGIDVEGVKILARNGIHIHTYNENYYELNTQNMSIYQKVCPDHFHSHPHISAADWTKEFSKYDAGWLHCYRSNNNGDLIRATWDDLNMPARLSTYASAGIPMIMPANDNNIVASKILTAKLGVGIFFNDYEELAYKLKEEVKTLVHSKNMMKYRKTFAFDNHVNDLICFFRNAIEYYGNKR